MWVVGGFVWVGWYFVTVVKDPFPFLHLRDLLHAQTIVSIHLTRLGSGSAFPRVAQEFGEKFVGRVLQSWGSIGRVVKDPFLSCHFRSLEAYLHALQIPSIHPPFCI